jgi:tetratricopeptide (TPR) repeat protein
MLGRWSEATQLCEKAVALVRRVTTDEWELAKALWYLGNAYRLQRRIEEAEMAYTEASDILVEYKRKGIEDKLLSGMIQLGLGKVYLKQPGRELKAKECLNESLKIHRSLGESFRIAEVLSEQGDLFLRLGKFEEAEMRLRQARERFWRLENVFYYAITLVTLSELYYEKGDFDRVHEIVEEITSCDNGLINYQLARVGLIAGKTHVKQGKYAEAADTFCTAMDRALKFNDQSFLEVYKEILGEIDRVTRNVGPDEALRLCESLIEFWESKEVASAKREIVQELLESVRQKQEEVRALTPIA